MEEYYCNFTKSNTPPWVFFTFFKLYKCYQIAQGITYYFRDCWKKFVFDAFFVTYVSVVQYLENSLNQLKTMRNYENTFNIVPITTQ